MEPQKVQKATKPKFNKPKLSSFTSFFKASLIDLGHNFWKYLSIIILPYALMTVIGLVGGSMYLMLKNSEIDLWLMITFGLLGLVALLVVIYISILSQIALILAIKEPTKKFKELLISAKPLFGKYLSTSLIASFTVMFFFLLLIIPGFIYSIFFAFVSLVFIYEGQTNTRALARSKFLVKDYWWAVAGRLLILYLIYFVFYFAFNQIDKAILPKDTELFTIIPQLIFGPLSIIYLTKLYLELKSIKGASPVETKTNYQVFAIISAVILAALLVLSAIALPALSNARMKARDAIRYSDIKHIQIMNELYFLEHNQYPEQLSDLEKTNTDLDSTNPSQTPETPSEESTTSEAIDTNDTTDTVTSENENTETATTNDAMEDINSNQDTDSSLSVPTDPSTKEPYRYQRTESGYRLCFDAEIGNESQGYKLGENCVTN